MKEVKLNEEEIRTLRKEAEKNAVVEGYSTIYSSGDIEDLIINLREAHLVIKKIKGLDVDSVFCEVTEAKNSSLNADMIRINYEFLGDKEEYLEKATRRALENKQTRYKEYEKLREEFE